MAELVTITSDKYYETLASGLWIFFLAKRRVDFEVHWGGRRIRAHRLLLDVFLKSENLTVTAAGQRIFNPPHGDVSVDFLLEFLYQGKVTVRKEQLANLLEMARVTDFKLLVDALEAATAPAGDRRSQNIKTESDPMPDAEQGSVILPDIVSGDPCVLVELKTEDSVPWSVGTQEAASVGRKPQLDSIKIEPKRQEGVDTKSDSSENDSINDSEIYPVHLNQPPVNGGGILLGEVSRAARIKMEPRDRQSVSPESSNAVDASQPRRRANSQVRWKFQPEVQQSDPGDSSADDGIQPGGSMEQESDEEQPSPSDTGEDGQDVARRRWLLRKQGPNKNVVLKLKRITKPPKEPRPRPAKKTHICTECGKVYQQKSHLNDHLLKHRRVNNFQCSQCPMRFYRLTHLTSHGVVHSGTRLFKCRFCPKEFARSHSLQLHERCHTGEKPFKCTNCKRCFSQRSNRNTHSCRCAKRVGKAAETSAEVDS